MERRRLAVVLIGILVVSSMGLLFVLNTNFNPIRTIERRFSGEVHRVPLTFYDLRDTAVSISFTDDPMLIFRLDYEPYPDSGSFSSDDSYYSSGRYAEYEMRWGDDTRFKSLNLTLGSSAPFNLVFSASNSSFLFKFDENANITGSRVILNGDTLTSAGVILTNAVEFGTDGFQISLICEVVFLDLDLPNGLNGQFHFQSTTELNTWSIVGWNRVGNDYETASTDQPLVRIGTTAVIAHLWLNA